MFRHTCESPNQHELEVLQCVIEQFDRFQHIDEIQKISILMEQATLEEFYSVRTQLLKIYKTELNNQLVYDELFYNALFSFLLLLAKYAPHDVEPVDENGLSPALVCSITSNTIEEKSRILTTNGHQFDGSSPDTFKWLLNKNHPFTGNVLDQREKNYLSARQKAIANPNNQIPEIPHSQKLPPRPLGSLVIKGAIVGLIIGTSLGLAAVASLGLLLPISIVPFIQLIVLCASLASVLGGAILGGLIGGAIEIGIKLKKMFSPTVTPLITPITARTEKIFSHIKEPTISPDVQATPSKSQSDIDLEAKPDRLSDISILSRLVETQPLLPKEASPPTSVAERKLDLGKVALKALLAKVGLTKTKSQWPSPDETSTRPGLKAR